MKLTAHLKKFSILKSQFSINRGFTLIELLVVIAIIGILAAALIATIDPLEQIKKSQDATTKNVAVEYLNALTRYYATHQAFPWLPTDEGGVDCTPTPTSTGTTLKEMSDCTDALILEKELKDGFRTSQALPNVILFYTGATTQTLEVCFIPKSKSQLAEAKYDSSGNSVASGGTHWCTK